MPLTKEILRICADDFKVNLPDEEGKAIDEAVAIAIAENGDDKNISLTNSALRTLLDQAKIDRGYRTVTNPRDGKPMKGPPVSSCILEFALQFNHVIAPEETTLD